MTRAFPNVTYEHPDGAVEPASDMFVVGEVTGSEAGVGFAPSGPSPDSRVPFDDPSAETLTILVTVEIEAALGPEGPVDLNEVRFRLTVPANDEQRQLLGAAALGRVALFLRDDDNEVFADPGDVYGLLDGANTLGLVADDGSVEFPVASGLTDVMRTELPTVDSMLARASEPPSHGGPV